MLNRAFIKETGTSRWIFRTTIRQFYKRIARRDHTMRLPTGERITLPISNHFASEVYVTRADVDWGSEKLLYSLLCGRGAFLDVGAHIGYYSLYIRPRVTEVFCFEPDPRVRVFLERNLAGKPGAHIVPCAVGAAPRKARFTLERNAELSHLSENPSPAKDEIEVDVVTVDSFVAARALAIEAIKIDVEGHDVEVIAGALGVIAEQQPIVLTEARPDQTLFALAQKVSYSVFAYVRDAATRKKSFEQLSPSRPPRGETKMLFLVPSRLVDEIERKAALSDAG